MSANSSPNGVEPVSRRITMILSLAKAGFGNNALIPTSAGGIISRVRAARRSRRLYGSDDNFDDTTGTAFLFWLIFVSKLCFRLGPFDSANAPDEAFSDEEKRAKATLIANQILLLDNIFTMMT
mmetsp:Transcript_2628/g.4070  ORF Transcript_2628/g.4070 Transcript_2628/m.4070 type:complete len:124 (-) Transcript_2628:91-462(-)